MDNLKQAFLVITTVANYHPEIIVSGDLNSRHDTI